MQAASLPLLGIPEVDLPGARPVMPRDRRWLVCGMAVWLAATGPAWAQASALPQVDVVNPSKAVFVDDVNFGKDPFFPKSTRRVATVVPTVVPTASSPDYSNLMFNLQGLAGTPERRLALINNYTLGIGEETDLKVGKEVVRVRCEEIKERSVVISFKGITRELRLREGL